MCLGAHAG